MKQRASLVVLLCAAGISAAQTPPPPGLVKSGVGESGHLPATQAVVTLKSGDVLRGSLVSDGDPVVIDHPILGRLSFRREDIASVRAMSPEDADKSTAAAQEAAAKVPAPAKPEPGSFWEGWKHSAALGLSGETGNSESFNLRASLDLTRATTTMSTSFGLVYSYETSDGKKSTDNGRAEGRNDWLPQGDNRWRPFVQATAEYDAFQDWDYRLSASGGFGYELIKTDAMLLLPRVGIGLSKEFGGSDNRIHPELLAGIDFTYTIDDRSNVFASGDSYWRLDDFPSYRLLLKAGYNVKVNAEGTLALKLGAEDRYDSSPGEDSHRNDLDYFVTLGFDF